METSHLVIMLILLGCMATYIPVFMCLFLLPSWGSFYLPISRSYC